MRLYLEGGCGNEIEGEHPLVFRPTAPTNTQTQRNHPHTLFHSRPRDQEEGGGGRRDEGG
jgi:hypothetical protein